jgi:hypothetical protein
MAAKKTSKKPSKSDFIRQQPADLSVADVIAAGKAAGINFTSSLVYMVRGPAGGKAATKNTAGKKSSSKKTGAKRAAKAGPKNSPTGTATPKTSTARKTATVNKADFVRQHASLSPKEIVSKAKAAGIELGVTYVYNVRGQDKTAAKNKTVKKGTASKQSTPSSMTRTVASTSKPTPSNGSRSSGSVEDLLKAAAAELGLGRALEILEGERARVRAVMGG